MAEEKTHAESNNMKFAVTVIIGLVVLLAIAVFGFQQKNNQNAASDTGSSTTENSITTTKPAQDAGALGKNEIKLTADNFKTEVENSKGVILVEFYLSTCPHCQNVAKEVTAAADVLVGKARVGKIDAKANNALSNQYEIESVPTFIVFKDGNKVDKVEGEKSSKELVDLVGKYLK